MTKNDIERNKLLRLGIFELRNMARDLGVRSPTTLTKEVMIEKMLHIIRGEVDPYTPQSKRGRPPKNAYKEYDADESSSVAILKQSTVNLEGIDQGTDVEVAGFVDGDENEWLVRFGLGNFYKPKSTFRISKEQIVRHNLKPGDFVRGMAKVTPLVDMPVVVKVEEINGTAAAGHKLNAFDELEIIEPFKPLNLPKLSTKAGARVVGFYQQINESYNAFMREIDKKEGFAKIFASIDCFPEEIVLAKGLVDTEVFYTTPEQNSTEHLGLAQFAINRAKALTSEGKDVLFVINGVDRIIGHQNLAAGKHLYDISSLSFVKKLLATARQLKKGSITVIALCLTKQKHEFLDSVKVFLEAVVGENIVIN